MAKKIKTPSQTMLFGMQPTPEMINDAVILAVPDEQMVRDVADMLDRRYTKTQLYTLAQAFHPILKNKTLLCQAAGGRLFPCKEVMPIFSSTSYKEHLERAIAYMLSDTTNLMLYVDSLSEEMKDLWRHVLVNIYVSEADAQKILKDDRPIFSTSPRSYYYHDSTSWARPGFELFNIVRSLSADTMRYHYRQPQNYITIDSLLHYIFFPLICPEAVAPDLSLQQLPEGGYRVFSMEAESYAKYHLLSSLLSTGKVKMTAKGVSQVDVKKVAKQLGLMEFMAGDGILATSRSRYYVEVMALYEQFVSRHFKSKSDSYEQTLRRLFANLDNLMEFLPSLLLPHIKGLRKQLTEYNRLQNLCMLFCQWMVEEPERWVSIYDVLLKIFVINDTDSYTKYDALVFDPSLQKAEVLITNEFSGKNIAVDSFVTEFGLTALQAFSFMLCSFGMAELALSPLTRRESPFACAEYIRLTPLGRYALGVTEEYEVPEQEHIAYFELDPDRLIIRSLVEPNPYAQLLLDTSVAISRNRFETSAQSFLAHCVSRSDVEEKIGIFRQFVSKELPPLWKQFFDSLLQHCNPLASDRTNYQIYRLSPDNTDLLRLLTSTPSLRKLFVRAEGYLILVKKDDQKRFTDELKKYGYLL